MMHAEKFCPRKCLNDLTVLRKAPSNSLDKHCIFYRMSSRVEDTFAFVHPFPVFYLLVVHFTLVISLNISNVKINYLYFISVKNFYYFNDLKRFGILIIYMPSVSLKTVSAYRPYFDRLLSISPHFFFSPSRSGARRSTEIKAFQNNEVKVSAHFRISPLVRREEARWRTKTVSRRNGQK